MKEFHKKESPFQGITGFAGGATGLRMSSAATKSYVDDVFSTYLYTGNATARSITNNVDLSGKGGMVWTKRRSGTGNNTIYDTERGATYYIRTNLDNAQTNDANTLSSFNSDGFSLGSDTTSNDSGTFGSWSFRESPGFFDVVSYTGNGSNRLIDHSLGSVPGMMMVKCTSETRDWVVWHRNLESAPNYASGYTSGDYYLTLNSNAARSSIDTNVWDRIDPTATQFKVGTSDFTNKDGESYIAYIFAGGSANSYALANSVDFDGSGDDLTIGSSSDWGLGTGDFTWEAWIKPTEAWTSGVWETVFMVGTSPETGGLWIGKNTSDQFVVRAFSDQDLLTWDALPPVGEWTHVAAARSGTTLKLFYNGSEQKSVTTSYDFQTGSNARIANDGHSQRFAGKVSNLRLVKGTAVYTSDFVPSDTLTNITNTVLLCCNNSSITGSTVTPATITSNGTPAADTDTPPFSDAAANIFGENEDRGIVTCGTYEGNGNASGPQVTCGFEPQWLMIKNADSTQNWVTFDCMRGIVTGGDDSWLYPNGTNAEIAADYIELTSTGFKLTAAADLVNGNGHTMIWCAIRRPDGYVGKPPSAGTDVFSTSDGLGTSEPFSFTSGFPVDFWLHRQPAQTRDWFTSARLIGDKYVFTNTADDEDTTAGGITYDSNTQVGYGYNSAWQAWCWKRYSGMDVVTYVGDGVAGRTISHSLNKTPEMIWVKKRDAVGNWRVGHKGLNGGTDPWNYNLQIETGVENSYDVWNNTSPTSTYFSLSSAGDVNGSTNTFIAMLFSSVDNISKVGYYTGNGTSSNTITVGFQPRFILFRGSDIGGPWRVLDSLRGMSSGNDGSLSLNTNAAAVTNFDWLDVTSTGFTINTTDGEANASGQNYIYYAHA